MNVKRVPGVKNKGVTKIAKAMEHANNMASQQSAPVIQASHMMALINVLNVKMHYSHSLTARGGSGYSVSQT